jgi:hypothetical protein
MVVRFESDADGRARQNLSPGKVDFLYFCPVKNAEKTDEGRFSILSVF